MPKRRFSTRTHAIYLGGYMDAAGRAATTEDELVSLVCDYLKGDADLERLVGAPIVGRSIVENWSREFGSLVDNLVGIDQRSRLGFYLVDTICHIQFQLPKAMCYKLQCQRDCSGKKAEALYVIECSDDQRIVISAIRTEKRIQNDA